MSQTYGTPPGGGYGGDYDPLTGSGDSSTRDVAADEARGVAGDAKAAGQQTAATAKDQATQVAGEAKVQAQQVYDQAKQELTSQLQDQHHRAASGLQALADELSSMVQGSDQHGVAGDLAQQASDRARGVAQWLESRQPGDVLEEVRSFARRRPGAFLAAAAVVGLVGGRLTRGMADQARDEHQSTGKRAAPYQPVTDFETEASIGGVPAPQHAYDPAPSGMSTMPATSPPTLEDPLTGETPEPYGGELR